MKQLLLGWLLSLSLCDVSSAASPGPIYGDFVWSNTVYVARVIFSDKAKVTFSITETLRGKPGETLTLTPAWGFEAKANTEGLLVSCDKGWQDKNMVGWLMAGYCGWIPAPIIHDGKERYVQTMQWISGTGMEKPDKVFSDQESGYTIEHIKQLLEKLPDENKEATPPAHS